MSYRGKSSSGFPVTTGRDGTRSFDEHDHRQGGGNDHRQGGGKYNSRQNSRGSYSRRGGRGRDYSGGGGYNRGPNPRSRLDDDGDINMSGDESSAPSTSRYNPYGSRPPSRRQYPPGGRGGRQQDGYGGSGAVAKRLGLPLHSSGSRKRGRGSQGSGNRRYSDTASDWHKITIPHGAKTDKQVLLKSITNLIDVPFQPVQFHHEQKNAVFYVNDGHAANAIRSANRRVTLPTGFKMIVLVRPGNPPTPPMNEEMVEKLKLLMSDRYDGSTKSLNLSSMYQDPKMTTEGLHLALNRYSIITQVIKIIKENIPELTSLNLSSNKLMSLDGLSSLVDKTPHLTHLDLSKNQLKSVEELGKIKKWKIAELVLDGNDLCNAFREKPAYISAVRKQLTNVLKLDGHDLPPPIKFDLESSTELPPTQDSYFKDDAFRGVVVKFLKQYYDIFDSGNRQTLIDAYHDEAVLTMAFGYNRMISGKQSSWPDLTTDSRNLLKMRDIGRRLKMMKRGKLSIVSYLSSSNFPKTSHDPNSFHVDVSLASNELLVFSVTGLFKESEGRSDRVPVRAFSRVFATVPQGGGIVITNDMISITNATPEQVQGAFKNPAPTPASSPVLGASPQQNPLGADGVRMTMVQQFCQQSRMNVEWTTKCLEQNEWNFEKAAKVFTELQADGKIPPEAFKH